MNTYTHSFTCECPSDGEKVEYHLHIDARHMIRVEAILRACKAKKSYHEHLADRLAPLGGLQIPIARHQGVTIRTTRGEL